MSQFSRREFVKTSIAVGAVSSVSTLPLNAATTRTATDTVTLGKSGVQVTRLAFGTGSGNGRVQSALGQQEFTRLVHYAYDRGIRFFETSESYTTPAMLGEALKAFPRDSYQLMSKVTTDVGADPLERFDEMRRTSQTEYFDILLLHWQDSADWTTTTSALAGRRPRSAIEAAHPRPRRIGPWPARAAPDARQPVAADRDDPHEPQGHAHGWARHRQRQQPGQRATRSSSHVKQVKKEGMGVISMKLVGDGNSSTRRPPGRHEVRFQQRRRRRVTVGYKNTQEIDEAIENLNLALA